MQDTPLLFRSSGSGETIVLSFRAIFLSTDSKKNEVLVDFVLLLNFTLHF